MKIGIFKTSLKENEKRLPNHLSKIPRHLKSLILLEQNYGSDFRVSDSKEFTYVSREELFASSELLILPKPVLEDFVQMRPRTIVFGWSHVVQNRKITDIAIEKELTLISWENMNFWSQNSEKLHIFYRNNGLRRNLTLSWTRWIVRN